MPRMEIPRKLLPFHEKNKRFKIAIGGRGSGKSMTIADLLLMRAQTEKAKVGCFREFMNSIDDSVHALLKAEIERLGLQGFDPLATAIRHINGAEFKFKGLARNPEGVKSAHGFKYFFVEEAQTISFESLKNLTPTLRIEGSEIWMAGNPRSSADPFSQRFIKPYEKELLANGYYEDDLHLIVVINYMDNPLFPDVLEQERKHDEQTLSKALYRHIWLGDFYDEVENTIIPVEWFDAAIDAHKKLGFDGVGAKIASHDPSDEGGDSKGYCLRHGSIVLDVAELTTGDVNVGMDWAIKKAKEEQADWFVWDCDGMGVSLKRQVNDALDGTKMDYFMFKGSETAQDADQVYIDVEKGDVENRKTNQQTFLNRRAQFYWKLRERFLNTFRAVDSDVYTNPDDMISLSSDIQCLDQLRAELCRIPLKRNNNGRIQIMTKLEMSKKPYQLPSPNMADSIMMAMFSPKVITKAKKINFEGWGG